MLTNVKRVILIMAVVLGISNVVYGTTFETTENSKEIETTFASGIQSRLYGIKSEYDLRDYISLKVKDQKDTSFCWAISATTALESYMQLVQNRQVEYSARHIEYATSKTFLDGENGNAYNREVNDGGNALMAYAYITSGRGPVKEEEMPFSNTIEQIKLEEIEGKTVDAQLDEYVVFPNVYKQKVGDTVIYTNGQAGENIKLYTDAEVTAFREQIKEHIVKYGGVTAQVNATIHKFYSNPDNIKASTCYYCDDETVAADHQVTIVGWDDNYAVSNFNEEHRPTKPGAYLVQNSFGDEVTINGVNTQVFDGGYIYISYEDFLIETAMTGITKMSDIDYDNLYQYDPLGCNKYVTNNSNEIAGANVFNKSKQQEWLNEVSFYTVEGCKYEIYVNSQDGELKQEKLKKVATIEAKNNVHYTTVSLEEPVLLTGSQFAIAIKYISQDTASLPVECALTYDQADAFYNATSNSEESFMCTDPSLQNWVDINDMSIYGIREINVCLKAFTTEVDEMIILLSSEKYNILEDEYKITKISPNTTVEDMKKNISTNATIKVYDKEKNELSNSDIIGTDATMQIVENGEEYKLVVTGDLNGDGKVTGTDLLKLKRHIVKLELLESSYLEAADVNFASGVTSTDLLKVKQAIVGIIKF